jgi:hypothetical protein
MSAADGPDASSTPPAPPRARRAVSVFFACALGGVVGAVAIAFLLMMIGALVGAFIGLQIGYEAGPLLGGALGVSLGLAALGEIERRRRRARVDASPPPPDPLVLRVFPEGRTGVLISWALGVLLLVSPFGLLRFGLLPPLSPVRLAVTVLLGALCFLQCARVRRFWPAIVLLAWPAAFMFAIDTRFPCWRGSNAVWCGHSCDGPPDPSCTPDDFGDPNPPAARD